MVIAGAVLVYLGLLIHPDPLFAHTLEGTAIVAHADVPIPARMAETIALAEAHIRTSPLFDPERRHHAYFCQSGWRWSFVSRWDRRAAAFALAPFGRATFYRPARLEENRMVGASGRVVEGERTLDYYIAHEITHTMTADHLGLRYYDLPIWVREGYADYVGREASFDYDAVRAQLIEGHPHTDPASGHYLRYVLLVAHELERRGVDVDGLLRHPRPRAEVEADVIAGR